METFNAMELGKSIRGYSSLAVEAEKLEKIVRAGKGFRNRFFQKGKLN